MRSTAFNPPEAYVAATRDRPALPEWNEDLGLSDCKGLLKKWLEVLWGACDAALVFSSLT